MSRESDRIAKFHSVTGDARNIVKGTTEKPMGADKASKKEYKTLNENYRKLKGKKNDDPVVERKRERKEEKAGETNEY